MKRILLILLMLSGLCFAQAGDNDLFGTTSSPLDTVSISDADSVAESRVIWLTEATRPDMLGALTLWGRRTLNSGTDRTITPYIRFYHRMNDATSYGPWHALTAIAQGDSLFEYPLPKETWYTYMKGYEVEFRTSGAAAIDLLLEAHGDHR